MAQNNVNRLTALHILIFLRKCLLTAIEQNDKDELRYLAKVFDMLWDVVDQNNVQGGMGRVIENFENAAREYASGIGWKSIIPSEGDIKAALGIENLPL